MSQQLPAAILRGIAQIADLGKLDALKRAIQAIVEGKPFGESSLDTKLVATFGDNTTFSDVIGFTEANFRETIVINGQLVRRHRNGGGWVPFEQDETDLKKPFVAESAYVGPSAKVLGEARVTGVAAVYGEARVYDNARVSDNAEIFDRAQVFGAAEVSGHAKVSDDTQVRGDARVSGRAWVRGSAEVYGNSRVSGTAWLRGNTQVWDQTITK